MITMFWKSVKKKDIITQNRLSRRRGSIFFRNEFFTTLRRMHRNALFWNIMRHRVVFVYRRFGTKYGSHFHGSRVDPRPLKMGPIFCPETSVNNYHAWPHNIPEERKSHQHRGASLKSKYRESSSHQLWIRNKGH
jgi:hypothetical protein